jgi:hypothetical protein
MKFNVRHKSKCGCVDCLRNINQKLGHNHTNTAVKLITKRYKKLIIKNLRFNITNRGRFEGRLILSKEFRGDEWIIINEYNHQLINCRKCKSIAKAYINMRLICCNCYQNRQSEELNTCIWGSWSKSA